MNYKKLGNTDLEVSTICLGTMTWGEQNTQTEGFEQMDYALEKGVNFWDTAEIYSIPPKKETFGDTEVIILRSSLILDSSPKNFKIVLTLTFLNIEANNADPFSLLLASTSSRSKS